MGKRMTKNLSLVPELSKNALRLLEKRYLARDADGCPLEGPREMLRRVARNIASVETVFHPGADVEFWERKFYRIMSNLEFLPNSPTLMNAGRELQQLAACFVLPVEDSIDSIFEAVKNTAKIHQSGGGTGFSLSELRPEGDIVGTTRGIASGPVSFMRIFDLSTEVIRQGGMRRGANMGVLNVTHPDIVRFITAKKEKGAFHNFNLSVGVTDEFIEKVKKRLGYKLINPRDGKVAIEVNAGEIFDLIVNTAWETGDPGLLFIDRLNETNPTPQLGRVEATNPCGEAVLLPFESCNLGSINLVKMLRYKGDDIFKIHWDKIAATVRVAVRFLDNVIEANRYPLPEIERATRATRKIGLGVMGFADMLIRLGVAYDSQEGIRIAEELMSYINKVALDASVGLAKERGPFPSYKGSTFEANGSSIPRNATRTTIAPTGSLSIIADCSSGIEPLFALSYIRNILEKEALRETNAYFQEVAKKEGFYSSELDIQLSKGKHLREIPGIPERIKCLFVTAHDISPEWHVRMQASFQKYTDNAVSKTVNLPHYASPSDVAKVFLLAYQLGCKGITVYRNLTRNGQPLAIACGNGAKSCPYE